MNSITMYKLEIKMNVSVTKKEHDEEAAYTPKGNCSHVKCGLSREADRTKCFSKKLLYLPFRLILLLVDKVIWFFEVNDH